MSTRFDQSTQGGRALRRAAIALAVMLATPSLLQAQSAGQTAGPSAGSSDAVSAVGHAPGVAAVELPEAPQPPLRAAVRVEAPKSATPKMARKSAKHIAFDEQAYGPLTVHDKIIIGARDLYSLGSILEIVASASYSQVLDGQPNYGHPNSYAKRLGASAITSSAQGVFTDMVFSPLLRQDPRYYQLGHGHGFLPRTGYAISRVLISRTDSGHKTLNGALLLGYASAAGLNQTYYPQINRNFNDAASAYGGSLGGAAIGFLVDEFSGDLLHMFHKN